MRKFEINMIDGTKHKVLCDSLFRSSGKTEAVVLEFCVGDKTVALADLTQVGIVKEIFEDAGED